MKGERPSPLKREPPRLEPPPRAASNSTARQAERSQAPLALAVLFCIALLGVVAIFLVQRQPAPQAPASSSAQAKTSVPEAAETSERGEQSSTRDPETAEASDRADPAAPSSSESNPGVAPARDRPAAADSTPPQPSVGAAISEAASALPALPSSISSSPASDHGPSDDLPKLLGSGLTALSDSRWQEAAASFEQALALSPDHPAAAEGLERARHALREERVAKGLSAAKALEEGEHWARAREAYASVLAIDQAIVEAKRGRDRNATWASLAVGLERTLEQPARLAAEEVRAEALALADRAKSIDNAPPGLVTLAAETAALVSVWSQPLEVALESDANTEVTIYRVGKLGKFDQRTLTLLPGRYTVVGQRRGYRDVRHTLELTPGSATPRLRVACVEAI